MLSKITFLGTAGDSFLVSKQIRNSSGIVLNLDNTQLILDPGPGSIINLNKNNINIRETTAIITTTNDILFNNDVNAIINSMTFDGIDIHGVLLANKTSMFGNDEEQPIILTRTKKNVERYIVLKPDQRIGINNIEIKTYFNYKRNKINKKNKEKNNEINKKINEEINKEINENSVSIKITSNDLSISYINNSAYNKKLNENLKNSTVLILSLRDYDEYSKENTHNLEDAIKTIKEISPNLVILTNFGIKVLKQDPIFLAREIHKKTNIQIISANDGLIITPQQFKRNNNQQLNLNSFK